jgi:short-subunit dehydrogenase
MNWADQTVVITGASQGIGRRLAEHFAPKCKRAIILARNGTAIASLANNLQNLGAHCDGVELDLRDPAAIAEFAARDICRSVDIVIHNAADTTSKPFAETSLEEIDSLMRTNVIGPLQLTRLLLPGMRERGRGAIVHLSSLAGFKPNPAQTVYSASKGGVNAMSDALRRELEPLGIRVVNLALPSVALDGAPAPGAIPVERVAAMIERAAAGSRSGDFFFSPVSRWLMRSYRAFPFLSELRMQSR